MKFMHEKYWLPKGTLGLSIVLYTTESALNKNMLVSLKSYV
jgi:hypothetical protein